MTDLPRSADPVFVEWLARDGGIRIVAWTNEKGIPYLGIFTLTRTGQPTGLPCWLRRRRFLSDVVIGFKDDRPITVRVFARARSWGLEAVIDLSRYASKAYRYRRHLFAAWHNSPPPYFGTPHVREPRVFPEGFLDRFLPEED